jgi:hypothetical protein
MTLVLIAALALVAGAAIALAFLAARQRKQLRALQARLAAHDGLAAGAIGVEILNPVDVATQRHWLGGILGTLTPELVRVIVQRETIKVLRTELAARGIRARVRAAGDTGPE